MLLHPMIFVNVDVVCYYRACIKSMLIKLHKGHFERGKILEQMQGKGT
jgi:hypothetical protein